MVILLAVNKSVHKQVILHHLSPGATLSWQSTRKRSGYEVMDDQAAYMLHIPLKSKQGTLYTQDGTGGRGVRKKQKKEEKWRHSAEECAQELWNNETVLKEKTFFNQLRGTGGQFITNVTFKVTRKVTFSWTVSSLKSGKRLKKHTGSHKWSGEIQDLFSGISD